jgi:hypothetical protein
MPCDKFMPGDRVRNMNYGIYGVVVAVRGDAIQVRWDTGQRTPVWTSDIDSIERLRAHAERAGKAGGK